MAWVIDNAHSQVEFSAKHMMITTVRGQFKKWTGTVNVDEKNPQNSTVEISIDAASVDTNEPNRDNHLRSADFLDAQNYPELTFRSRRIEFARNDPASDFKLIGDLTIHGVTREVVL